MQCYLERGWGATYLVNSLILLQTDLRKQENSVVGVGGLEYHYNGIVRHGYSGDIREPSWCNGRTLAQNARDMSLILTLDKISPIFTATYQ